MKVAISVPDPIFEAAEKLAKSRSVPRSKLYAEALSAYVETHSETNTTKLLNAVYAETSSELEEPFSTAQSQILSDETW